MSEGAGAVMPEGYIPPNIAPKCEWALGKDKSLSPHRHLQAEWVLAQHTVGSVPAVDATDCDLWYYQRETGIPVIFWE